MNKKTFIWLVLFAICINLFALVSCLKRECIFGAVINSVYIIMNIYNIKELFK